MWKFVALAMILAGGAFAQQQQKYTGPRPPKPDLPYLLHATELLATEAGEAKEESRKEETANIVSGAASPVRTPLPEPILLVATEKLAAEKLELYKMTTKGGGREVTVPKSQKKMKNAARPVRLTVTRLEPGLYRVEAGQILENGEYCLSPQGSQQVFCFQVY
jgi:hypothetical protein